MYHVPKPFWRPKKCRWYVELEGKHVNLGPHPEGFPPPAKGKEGWNVPRPILEKYHRLMAAKDSPQAAVAPQIQSGSVYVVSVLDAYLDWLKKRVEEGSKAPRTYNWYADYLQSFVTFQTADYRVRDLTIDALEPIHVYAWVDAQPGWKTGKRGAMTSVQRAFNWAAKAGLLKSIGGHSPLKALEKPQQGRREKLVSEQEYQEVLSAVRDDEFRDLLELAWETGCRPHELFTVEAAYADLETARWVFPVKLSKGKKVQRVVYLSDRALEITRKLLLKRPAGPLLLNTEGGPWCVSSVKCRFQIICRELGRRRLRQSGGIPPKIPRLKAAQRKDPETRAEHQRKVLERRQKIKDLARACGIRLNLYAFRHSMITESLVSGLDAVTVSVLAGHRDTTMISRVYAHLTQKHEHMRQAANRVRGTNASA